MLTEAEVLERLRAAVDAAGGQRRFAEAHGFTPGYVNDVLWRKRGLADRILATIGVERMTVYQLTNVATSVAQETAPLGVPHQDTE